MITTQYFVRVGCYTGTASTLEEAREMEKRFDIYTKDSHSFTAEGKEHQSMKYSDKTCVTEHFREKGIYDGDVWRFYKIENAERHPKESENWKHILQDFKKYLGKKWMDKKDIRYLVNGNPVYKEYTIIGIEDNEAWADYYWILEDDKGKRKYELANDADFYKSIKE